LAGSNALHRRSIRLVQERCSGAKIRARIEGLRGGQAQSGQVCAVDLSETEVDVAAGGE
jgi:hypothetical protein